MIENRSVPPGTILPHVVYQDVAAAVAWLSKAFGFREHYHYGDPSEPYSGAQVHLGNAWIMLRKTRPGSQTPSQAGYETQSLTVFVDDVEAHFRKAKEAGTTIVEELHETMYGELQYAATDLDGHHWLFSRHAHDVAPDEWGATVVGHPRRLALLRRPRLCYLEIPAADLARSVAFYEAIFGWNIRHRETNRPSFDDATGNISGAWVTGCAAARESGLLAYIWVDSIDATAAKVTAHGGAIVKAVDCDSPGSECWIATFRDPAGNLIGLYQEGPR